MFGELIKKIKTWYKGDPGLIDSNPATGIDTVIREPYRHWVAKLLSYPVGFFLFLIDSIKRHPSAFISQTLAVIAIVVSCLSIYLQFYVDDDEYKRCTITHSNNQEITLNCKK
ncbi:hypothetical protein F886_00083 [Acinetobacter sp. NIPH 542]|uniref:hypothetical protein n=1 Tax=Acinetobacter sp. NIPH 542 TaxID=1217688 RepID=UPI0002CFC641|nr:hypothetical protein [Acinetobacter sp. NIPH 542]ENX48282.1 hypothetical protein F886_00083 [Acinetobacter sp. NIPH 542]